MNELTYVTKGYDQSALGAETIEEIYERDRLAVSNMDDARWLIGDDSLLLVPLTNEDGTAQADYAIADHAKEIGMSRDSIKAYRKNAKFYPNPERDDFRAKYPHPLVTYSHFRSARKMGDVDSAYEMLEEAAGFAYTVDQLEFKIAERLGTLKQPDAEPDATPGPLLETIALKLSSWHPATGEIALIIDNVAAVDTFVNGWRKTKNPVVLTITEVEIGE